MSVLRRHSPAAISPSIQGNVWHSVPSDQQSKTSDRSVGTVQRHPSYKPSPGSVRSLGSNSSAGLRVGKENVVARRNSSQSSRRLSPYLNNPSPVTRTSNKASNRSSWGNDLPQVSYDQKLSSLLAEAGPLEDIDLNTACGESLDSRHAAAEDAESNTDRGLSFDIKKQETLSTPRLPSNARREVTGPRSFKTSTEHPYKSENPLKRLVGNLRTQGPKRRHSLTARKERWVLDDFDEEEPIEVNLPQSRRLNGHQKASSWSSSGIRNAIKSATVRLQSATNRPHSPIFSRSRLSRSNRGSRISNAASRLSTDGDLVAARMVDHAARDRAVKRRRILEELVSSEESYVADLKVLLHVSCPHGPQLGFEIADKTFQGLFLYAQFGAKGPSSYTARDLAERCRNIALARGYSA